MRRRHYGFWLAALLLTLPAIAQPAGPGPAENAAVLVVHGSREVPLGAAALAALPQAEQEVTYESSRGAFRAVFRGAPLLEVLRAAGVLEGLDGRRRLALVLRVTGRDGHVVALALAEIEPGFGAKPVLLAWAMDGQPLSGGELRLALPGDRRGGRNVRDVVRVAVE